MDGRGRKILVRDLNSHLICVLCGGYYIEATSISECLHTFCKACIVKYLETNKFCPICDVQLHKGKPLLSIRPDKTLQRLVYKVVPGLYSNEMQRRRQFYLNTEIETSTDTDISNDQALAPHEQPRSGSNIYYSPEDSISLSLEYYISGKKNSDEKIDENGVCGDELDECFQGPPRRYLQCPAGVKMYLLKKFLRTKYNLAPEHKVDIIYADECLPDEFSLMDVAYTFMWNRATPMRFSYRIFERSTVSVPATYMGPTSSPQPALTSDDTPDAKSQPSSRGTNDVDASSKGRQIYGDKRRLRESDSDAETASNQKTNLETTGEKGTEPPIKKVRISAKKSGGFKKKANGRLKNSERLKTKSKASESKVSSKNSQKMELRKQNNIEKKPSKEDVVIEEPIKTVVKDTANKGEIETEEKNQVSTQNSHDTHDTLDLSENYLMTDQQMENDDLEEDDEDRLRISASEEDNTQEEPMVIAEDVVEEEQIADCPPEPEVTKKVKEKIKEVEPVAVLEKKEDTKREEKEVEIKVRRKKEKRAQKDKKHHHHHRHHDRNWDHSPPPAATILHSPDMKNDIMKLKVKLTAVKPDDQSKYYHRYNNHSPTRYHNSRHKTAYIVSEESNDKSPKRDVSNADENSENSSITDDVNEVKTPDSNKHHQRNSRVEEKMKKTAKDSDQTSSSNASSSMKNSNKSNSISIKSPNNSNNHNSNNSNMNSNTSKNNNNNCNSNSVNKNISNSTNSSGNISNGKNNYKDTFKNINDTNSCVSNKEKLLQMRAIRHKTVPSPKETPPTYVVSKEDDVIEEEEEDDEFYSDDIEEIKSTSTILIPPSSITVSKITAAEKRKMDEEKLLMMSGKHNGNGIDSKRPSLEIMLVNAPASKSIKTSSQEEKSPEKVATKSLKGPPPSIPLVRIQKLGNSPMLSNRHSMMSQNHKMFNNNNNNNNKLNKLSSFPNKTIPNKGKDGKPKQKSEDDVRQNNEKQGAHALSKSKHSNSQDDFGALDLSDKSSRKGFSSASSTSSENSNSPSPNSLFPANQNLNARQYSFHGSPSNVRRSPSASPPQVCAGGSRNPAEQGINMFPPSMRNLLTLSDTAAHIRDMMAARDGPKGQPPHQARLPSPTAHTRSPQRYLSESPTASKPSSGPRPLPSSPTQLNIPTPNTPLNNKLMNRGRIGVMPNLNEITTSTLPTIGRGRSNVNLQNNRSMQISKPGQNQTVRHIPNPSALLFRQQNQLKSMNATVSPGPTSPSKRLNVNGRIPNMPPPPPAIPLSSLRRMESMTRNIEKVAAGLSVKAAVEAGYGVK